MRQTDIAIVGAGLAGSIAATMLGRAGHDVTIIDPRPVYRPEFRCEKIDGPQMRVLEKTGLADTVRAAATHDRESWVARRGRIVEKRPGDQWGIRYEDLVNTVRGEIPPSVTMIDDRVTDIATSPDRQTLTLGKGEELSARLVILANGLNFALREKLGITRQILSRNHSVSIGFDIKPVGRDAFDFPALTIYSDDQSDKLAYLTMFPIGTTMRANLFGYHDPDDPWLKELRENPTEVLAAAMPSLRKLIGDFSIPGTPAIRHIDLYVSRGLDQPGLVLVGDAYSTSCPAAGTGTLKVFTDVERLCNHHVARWLEMPDMAAEKIAQFYADPVKRENEEFCRHKAFGLRTYSTSASPLVAMHRRAKYHAQRCRGWLRQINAPSLQPDLDHDKDDVLGA